MDWERNRIRVPSPKTAHHEEHAARWIPLFPELRPHLADVFDAAEPGTQHVITRYREGQAHLRSEFTRILRRAGLQPWPKLFHNLRASRQTELAKDYPMHVVCAWIGNSKAVAMGHYLQVVDADFERAAQSGAAIVRADAHESTQEQAHENLVLVVRCPASGRTDVRQQAERSHTAAVWRPVDNANRQPIITAHEYQVWMAVNQPIVERMGKPNRLSTRFASGSPAR